MNVQVRSLTHPFFPYRKISEVPIKEIQAEFITIFKIWGLPKWIKVDNGRPLGDPQLELIPPLALWLMALGLVVIWNRPKTPQDNAKVERGQGTLANWTEFEKCQDTFALQVRLWEEAQFYNYHFPIRRLGHKKRIEAFPQLGFTGKDWNPADFDIQRALSFLAKGTWERKVSVNGQFSHYGNRFNLGTAYKHQRISLKLSPKDNQWKVYDEKAECVKEFHTNFSNKTIWNLDFSI